MFSFTQNTHEAMALWADPTHWVAALSVAIKMHVKIKNHFFNNSLNWDLYEKFWE